MYNNTFWKSNWLGVAVGPSVSRLEAYNNIAQCIDYTFMAGTYNASDHRYDYNLVGMTGRGLPVQTHDVSTADPKFRRIPTATDNTAAHLYRDVTAADFELLAGSPAIDKGMSGGAMPAVDFYGRQRTAPFDLGAIEYRDAAITRDDRRATRRTGGGLRALMISRRTHAPACGDDREATFDLHGRPVIAIGSGCLLLKQGGPK